MIAAPLVAANPAPVRIAAAKSCHGAPARAQPNSPRAVAPVAARVIDATPNRQCSSGRRMTIAALKR
jgi:hypothetical protein